ncbi:hypothetical protein P8452_74866 [Trifolium repens]|nr:hypothetical protein P8452_74866 [Trifolium repens]
MLKVCVYIKLSIFCGSFAAAGNSSLWFLREHQSECADYGVDAYSAACLKSSPYAVLCARPGGFPSSQVILPLAPTIELEEFLEVVRIEGHAFSLEDVALACDMYLLQDGPTSRTLAAMALQYLRSFVGSVQRVSLPWKLLTLDQMQLCDVLLKQMHLQNSPLQTKVD